MKKAHLPIAILLTCTGLMSSASASAENIQVGFSIRTLNGPFFSALESSMKEAGKKEGMDIITIDAGGDLNKQVSDAETLVSKGIKYLILDPQDPLVGATIANAASKKGVKVITVDSYIADGAQVVTRVQPADEDNNLMLGEYAAKQFGSKEINLALISGNQGNLGGENRRTNFINGVIRQQLLDSNKTHFRITTQLWGNWDQMGGMKTMEDIIVSSPDTNAVYAENDDMALGAIRVLQSSGKLNKVRVYSYDGSKKGYKAVIENKLQATAENNPVKLAYETIGVIKKVESGTTDFPDYLKTKAILVTPDNVKQIYKEDSVF
ncbi:substrate-binding domain-containing protein [Serratia sp. CY54717]|uniref:substrate-binding domain-containing protein n=1 Tax=Serratia sp. CY54717 TaxID=3383637 RepID=UPI003F9FD699